jgi:hypothetical protein
MASMEEICDAMFKMVEADAGKVRYKPRDLEKAMKKELGASKQECKAALKNIMDSGRLIYGYYGGVSIELPHEEGSAK